MFVRLVLGRRTSFSEPFSKLVIPKLSVSYFHKRRPFNTYLKGPVWVHVLGKLLLEAWRDDTAETFGKLPEKAKMSTFNRMLFTNSVSCVGVYRCFTVRKLLPPPPRRYYGFGLLLVMWNEASISRDKVFGDVLRWLPRTVFRCKLIPPYGMTPIGRRRTVPNNAIKDVFGFFWWSGWRHFRSHRSFHGFVLSCQH